MGQGRDFLRHEVQDRLSILQLHLLFVTGLLQGLDLCLQLVQLRFVVTTLGLIVFHLVLESLHKNVWWCRVGDFGVVGVVVVIVRVLVKTAARGEWRRHGECWCFLSLFGWLWWL